MGCKNNYLIPSTDFYNDLKWLAFAEEADVLNEATQIQLAEINR
mgnify:CR=1 FL=1